MTAGLRRTVRAVAGLGIAVAVLGYAGPKLLDLNGLPRRMDASVDAAARYNPGLEQFDRTEGAALANLAPLDQIRASLTQVLQALTATGGDLAAAAARVDLDLTVALDPTVPALDRLAASLGDLEARTRDLGPPLASSTAAIDQARQALAQVRLDTANVATSLHGARVATDGATANVFGAGH